ncbi:MAG: acetylserotonin O-methyltransferase [Methanoregulaceae archaeon]|nr:acetylserotonin O-methyltransferase [Methanoregulaceae archaeon]
MSGREKDTGDLMKDPQESPSGLFDLLDRSMEGVYRVAAINAGLDIGLFDLCERRCTSQDLAKRTGCDPGMIERLCVALASIGLLDMSGDGYRTTRLSSVFLVRDSPFAQVEYVRKLVRHMRDYWVPLPGILREGPVKYRSDRFFAELSLPAMAENALCGRLQATVREIAKQPGFPEFLKMVDLGGGHGLYAIAIASLLPSLEAYVFDLPFVTTLADQYIREYGMEDRVHTIAGDFFTDEIGSGYDLVFSSSNPSGKSERMLQKISAALKEGGIFVNEQATGGREKSPFTELEWLLWTLDGEKKGGERYTKEKDFLTQEYLDSLRDHNLDLVSVTEIEDNYHTGHSVKMIIAKKR